MDAFFITALIIQLSTGAIRPEVDMEHPYKTYEACVRALEPHFQMAESLVASGELVVTLGCMMRKEHKA